MFITGINEIINVWANDANKLTVFISVLILPLFIYILYGFYVQQIKEIRSNDIKINFLSIFTFLNVEFIMFLIILSYIVGLAGFGQLILLPIIDAVLRAIGVSLYVSGTFLLFFLLKGDNKNKYKTNYKENGLYSLTRHPKYTFIIMMSYGISLMTVNVVGIVFSIFLLTPITVARTYKEEKKILQDDEDYIDYKVDIPMIFPDLLRSLRMKIIENTKIKSIREKRNSRRK